MSWFIAWLGSYLPTLIERPEWHNFDTDVSVDDILFLKSSKEFDMQHQYGWISSVRRGRDGKVRTIEVEYQSYNEGDAVIIHRVDELSPEDDLYYLCS